MFFEEINYFLLQAKLHAFDIPSRQEKNEFLIHLQLHSFPVFYEAQTFYLL